MISRSVWIALSGFVFALVFNVSIVVAQDNLWAPPEPNGLERDWIQISSGEWLWGEITLMRDETLGFDSEELDNVSIDWDKIVSIRSARVLTYVVINGTMVSGTSTMQDKVIRVETSEGFIEIPQNRIHSILDGAPTEWNYWSAKLGINLDVRTGNTEQANSGFNLRLLREAARSRVDLRYVRNSSVVQDIETVSNQRINAEWKFFLSRQFFMTPFKNEMYFDKFQNLDIRASVGCGAGYFIARSKTVDFYVELGASYQKTKYLSVEPGADGTELSGMIPFRTTLETDLTSSIELTAEYGVQFGLAQGSNTVHHANIILDFDLYGDIDFTSAMTLDYSMRPKKNAEGIVPEKGDLALAFGLTLDF